MADSETKPVVEETPPAPAEEQQPEAENEPKAAGEKPAVTAEPLTTEEVKEEPKAEAEQTAEAEPPQAEGEEKKEEQAAEEVAPEPEPEPIEIPAGNGELVLVTGSTGYLASHVIKTLLDSGEFKVRGTVRSLEGNDKLDSLKTLLENSTHAPEFVEADLTKPEGWTEAVKGCDYVIHTASPFPMTDPANPSDVIDPARDGTLVVLKAASESGTVKRVVLTSSCAAITSGRNVDKNALNEDIWADSDKAHSAYDKSKTIAERAAWDFMKELPEGNQMELSVVNPGLITGPPLMKMECTSVEVIKKLMNREYSMLPKVSFAMCDVRDVALAHVRAMMIKQAAGHRHIVASSSSVWLKDMANILSQEFSSKGFNIPTTQAPYVLVWLRSHFDETIKRFMPDLGKMHTYDNTRMKTILQVEPRDQKSSLVEMGHTMINLGILQKVEKPEKKSRKLTFRRKKESKDKVEEGEEKKDEPEKIKDGSANGSDTAEPAKIEDVKVEVEQEVKADVEEPKEEAQPSAEVSAEEVKSEEVVSDGEKPAATEEVATVSSEEEIKEEKPDPESSKAKVKKEKSKKEKKSRFPFSFSFKKNKKPQVEKKDKSEEAADDETAIQTEDAPAAAPEGAAAAEATPAEDKPAAEEAEPAEEKKPEAGDAPEAKTEDETPAPAAEPAPCAEEAPAASTGEETPKTETPAEDTKTTTASEQAPQESAPSEE